MFAENLFHLSDGQGSDTVGLNVINRRIKSAPRGTGWANPLGFVP